MTLPTFTIDDILSWNPCQGYGRPTLVELLGEGPLTAFNILALQIPVQDRLWVIVRPEVVGEAGVAAIDAWAVEMFNQIPATTISGENCKNNWPQPTEFQRVVMLSELLRHETGSDDSFLSEILSILEGI